MRFLKLLFLLLIPVSVNAQISGGLPPVKKSEPQKPASSQTKSNNIQVKSEENIAAEREDAFWNEIKTLSSKEAYEIYLKRYPNGRYVEVAKANIQSLTSIAPSYLAQNQTSKDTNQLLPGMVLKDCTDCPSLVVVPGGKFQMGAQPGEEEKENWPENLRNRSQPQHEVRIKSFLAGQYEVTVAQYEAFVLSTNRMHLGGCVVWNGSKFELDSTKDWKSPGFTQFSSHPVVCINPADASAYVRWLSQSTGKEFRLMSESEWEYAARSGTDGPSYWHGGSNSTCLYSNMLDQQAKNTISGFSSVNAQNCNDGNSYTGVVGSYKPNAFGLYDVIGNVWEWTQDCWNVNYIGAPTDGSAWFTGNCTVAVTRGGGWSLSSFPVWRRNTGRNDFRSSVVGFRVARSI